MATNHNSLPEKGESQREEKTSSEKNDAPMHVDDNQPSTSAQKHDDHHASSSQKMKQKPEKSGEKAHSRSSSSRSSTSGKNHRSHHSSRENSKMMEEMATKQKENFEDFAKIMQNSMADLATNIAAILSSNPNSAHATGAKAPDAHNNNNKGEKRKIDELSPANSDDEADICHDPEDDLLTSSDEEEHDINSDFELDEELKDSQDVGPEINAKIAQLVDMRLSKPLSEEKMKAKIDAYKRPANVDLLLETKVNPAIWADMRPETRARDIKLKKIQGLLMKGMQAVTILASDLHEARKTKEQKVDLEKTTQKAIDAIALLATANRHLNVRRRESIKPDLNNSYKRLCSPDVPITKQLFGDDLAKHCKEIKEVNQVSKNISRNDYSVRGSYGYKPYKGKGKYNNYTQKKGFLSQKKPQTFKKKSKGDKYRD